LFSRGPALPGRLVDFGGFALADGQAVPRAGDDGDQRGDSFAGMWLVFYISGRCFFSFRE